MKKSIIFIASLLIGLLLFNNTCYCLPARYGDWEFDFPSFHQSPMGSINPVDVFEQVWQIFYTNYPYFEHSEIDWSALYKVYRAKLNPHSTDEELFGTLCSMLGHLKDFCRSLKDQRNLTMNSLLDGLGIISSPDILTLETIDKTNKLRTISVYAEKYPFKDDMFHNWFWHYNAVPDFIKNPWDAVETKKPEKLIVDLRNNLGGTNDYLQPLIHGIIRHDKINHKGHLFVMISRKTFSVALHCATLIQMNAQPIFAGEPTGAAPNHFADPDIYTLPNSKLLLLVSTTWWQNSGP